MGEKNAPILYIKLIILEQIFKFYTKLFGTIFIMDMITILN